MWAGPAQINGPGSTQGKRWANIGPEYFFLLFLGGAGLDQPIGLSHNWLGPNAMLNYKWTVIVHVLHATERLQKLQTGRGEAYRGLLSRPWSGGWADGLGSVVARNGGRGSKRRRRKREGLQRGERKVHGGSWWSVGGFLWWSWWWKDQW